MSGNMRLDIIRNDVIRDKVAMTPIRDKMREKRFRWFGHVKMTSVDTPMKRCKIINLLECGRSRGQLKKR